MHYTYCTTVAALAGGLSLMITSPVPAIVANVLPGGAQAVLALLQSATARDAAAGGPNATMPTATSLTGQCQANPGVSK